MSAEVAKPARIALVDLQPGDVLFFGSRGTRSTSAEVGHSGIYVGNGWFVHSSSAGVTLQPLSGWYSKIVRVGATPARRGRARTERTGLTEASPPRPF